MGKISSRGSNRGLIKRPARRLFRDWPRCAQAAAPEFPRPLADPAWLRAQHQLAQLICAVGRFEPGDVVIAPDACGARALLCRSAVSPVPPPPPPTKFTPPPPPPPPFFFFFGKTSEHH